MVILDKLIQLVELNPGFGTNLTCISHLEHGTPVGTQGVFRHQI